MSTILHIQGTNRGERSFSLRTAEAFLDSYRKSHPDDVVKTIDLAEDVIPEFDALAAAGKYRILHGEQQTSQEAEAWKVVEAVIEEFKSVDKYVVSSPMWNFCIPYRLKQYIDVIVQPGYTFSYSPEKGYSGLVTGRPVVFCLARGGQYGEGTESAAYDFQRPYLETIFQFMGFTDIHKIVVEPTLEGGPEQAKERLGEAVAAAREMAAGF